MRTDHEEVSNRPYPGGGADYELEIYPVVQRVEGIESGVYYYHPLQHRLFHVADANVGWKTLLRDAAGKARTTQLPDVLFCVTGRFQRLSYKYSSIAYAIMLKDLGVLYQTFYLVATAMELAPCALGGGNADLFTAVTGLDYVIEPYIGEFMLSSRDEAEWIKFTPPQVAPPAP
jgi:SagB-type dehydrogenase family enzyme